MSRSEPTSRTGVGIGEDDRRMLLAVAREALRAHVCGETRPVPSGGAELHRGAPVFVSLHMRGKLRGCIGHLECDEALASAVARCAVAAGSVDPRFSPLTVAELTDVVIEISVLGPFETIGSPNDFEVGRHGLMVEHGPRRGLLLPQVAVQWAWDRETFLAEACRKAGLPANTLGAGADVWRFEAEVFGEW